MNGVPWNGAWQELTAPRPRDFGVPESFITLGHVTGQPDRAFLFSITKAMAPDTIVEVGCFTGMSTLAMAQARPRARIWCVDHFQGNHNDRLGLRNPDEVLAAFCSNVGERLFSTIFPTVGTSEFWGSVWPRQVDMVFIDALHDYESVKRDIELWTPHIRKGGLLIGHDYATEYPGVVQAADEIGITGAESRLWWKII